MLVQLVDCEHVFSKKKGLKKLFIVFFVWKNWFLLHEVEYDRVNFQIGLGMTSKSIPGGALVSAPVFAK